MPIRRILKITKSDYTEVINNGKKKQYLFCEYSFQYCVELIDLFIYFAFHVGGWYRYITLILIQWVRL